MNRNRRQHCSEYHANSQVNSNQLHDNSILSEPLLNKSCATRREKKPAPRVSEEKYFKYLKQRSEYVRIGLPFATVYTTSVVSPLHATLLKPRIVETIFTCIWCTFLLHTYLHHYCNVATMCVSKRRIYDLYLLGTHPMLMSKNA